MLANPAPSAVAIDAPLTTFGEVKTSEASARVQIDGVYGLTETDFETFTNLEPGDVLAVCVQTASSTATVDASLNWLEE